MIWRDPVCGQTGLGISSLQAVRAEGYAELVVPVLKGLI